MSKKPKTLHQRIGELEDELKQRDARIRELRNDLNKAEALITEERKHVEDASALIDSWIEAFGMTPGEDGKWTMAQWLDDAVAARDQYLDLVKKWNRHVTLFNNTVTPRNVGRPLGATLMARRARRSARCWKSWWHDEVRFSETERTGRARSRSGMVALAFHGSAVSAARRRGVRAAGVPGVRPGADQVRRVAA